MTNNLLYFILGALTVLVIVLVYQRYGSEKTGDLLITASEAKILVPGV